MLVELAPQQFVDPRGGPRAAAVQFAVIGRQRGAQGLAWRQHACRQIGRQATGGGQRWKIAFVLVGIDGAVGEGGQAVAGRGFARGPERAHGIGGRVEAVKGLGQGIGRPGRRRLRARRGDGADRRRAQAFAASAGVGRVDTIAVALAGEHAARTQQRCAMVQGPVHADGLQAGRDGGVAAAFVDGPLGVGMNLRDRVRLAEPGDGGRGFAPVMHGQQLHGNACLSQAAG
ncbi:hypothetical protein D3C86_1197420 [compost metagenome]